MQDLKSATAQVFATHAAGNFELAESMYDQILTQLKAPDFNILYGYGSLLVELGRFGIGISLLQTAAKMHDHHPGLWTNLGVAYKQLALDDLALSAFEKAISIEQGTETLSAIAGFYINRDEAEKAEEYSRRALAIKEHPAARMHLGLALLEQGKLKEAWPHYEARWDSAERRKWKRTYASPKWDGSRVRKLVIHGEQGLGDEIQFMSLFPIAKERAGEIVIECADRLVKPFRDAFRVKCYATERELREHEFQEDAHIAMGSLPLVLGLPDGKPFMPRPNTHNAGKPIIGIAWRGGTQRTNKDFRTLKLEEFKPIFDSIDASFVSVQYGGDYIDDEAKKFGLITGPRDFDSLQFRIGTCDLVITVCQTAVHQAGAMGVPCWVLTPRKSAWRYKGADMMPWYRSVQLFKQQGDEDWSRVIAEIADQLKEKFHEEFTESPYSEFGGRHKIA